MSGNTQASLLELQGLTFGPPPAWLDEAPWPTDSAGEDRAVRTLLVDHHADLVGETALTLRLVREVRSREGLEAAGTVTITFDPAFQRVVVHRVRVVRGGVARDHGPEGFQLLQREQNLQRRVFDGALTGHLQLPDLRVGDVIDTWVTTIGAAPDLGGWFRGTYPFAYAEDVARVRVRVRTAPDRELVALERPGSEGLLRTDTTEPGARVRSWERSPAPPFRYEPGIPNEWRGHLRVTLADAMEWTEVAAHFLPLYAVSATLPDGLEQEAAAIAASTASPAERAVSALRLLQRQIRYVSMNLDGGGHRPRPIELVWDRRFGDCKDVSMVLCALLRRLGVDAVPALTRSWSGTALAESPPGVAVFDHCLVRARLDGRAYWLDATWPEQGGDLEHLVQPPAGLALPLEEGGVLEPMGSSEVADLVDIDETWRFGPGPADPCELRVTTTYGAWRADGLRADLRNNGFDAVARAWFKYYATHWPDAESVASPIIEDDGVANRVRVVEQVRLPKPWKPLPDGRFQFRGVDDVFGGDLALPVGPRTQPVWLGRPRRLRRRSRYEVRTNLDASWRHVVEAAGFRGRSELVRTGLGQFELTVEYVVTAAVVESEALQDLRKARGTLVDASSVVWAVPARDGRFEEPPEPEGLWLALRSRWQSSMLFRVVVVGGTWAIVRAVMVAWGW